MLDRFDDGVIWTQQFGRFVIDAVKAIIIFATMILIFVVQRWKWRDSNAFVKCVWTMISARFANHLQKLSEWMKKRKKNIENENQLQHLISYLPFYVDYSVEQQSNKRAIDFGAKF